MEDKTEEKFGRTVILNKKQVDFIEKNYIRFSPWISDIVDLAISLKEKNKEVIKILQDEIDESN